jgi:serine/threonine-protein kinase
VQSASSKAAALSKQGQVLLDTGRVTEACAKFEASEALFNDLGTMVKLGDCYERAGRTASAWHTFLEAQAMAHDNKDSERELAATLRVTALEPKLTRVTFIVPTTSRVPGLSVRLGANTVSALAWGSPIVLDPGIARVSATAKGYAPWRIEVDATHSEGRNFRINVPPLNPVPMANNDRQNAYRTAGMVTGGVGLAGLGAGAVFNALSHNADDTKSCAPGAAQCTPNKGNRNGYADAATVSLALGGALVATGVTLFVLAPAPDKQEKHALRVAARVTGSGGRLQLEGAW